MFTGLVTRVGTLQSVEAGEAGGTLFVQHEAWEDPVEEGESIAVNGCCLTASHVGPEQFRCELLKETLDRTSLGGKRVGDALNLERALRVGDRLGGHILSGHIDGVAEIDEIRPVGRDRELIFQCDPALSGGMVMKGSIACDGISLTLASISKGAFSVHIIPFTLEQTNLGSCMVGDVANVEIDMIGKYVKKHLDEHGMATS
jgi:riboflavin synthase